MVAALATLWGSTLRQVVVQLKMLSWLSPHMPLYRILTHNLALFAAVSLRCS
jgi:hypothetical protein